MKNVLSRKAILGLSILVAGSLANDYQLDDLDKEIAIEDYEENTEKEADYINLMEEDVEDIEDNKMMMMERDPEEMTMVGDTEDLVLWKMKLRGFDTNDSDLVTNEDGEDHTMAQDVEEEEEMMTENDPEEMVESDPMEMVVGSNAEELVIKKTHLRSVDTNKYKLYGESASDEVPDEDYVDTEDNEMTMESAPEEEMMMEKDPMMTMMESNAKEENIGKMRLRGAAASHNYHKLDYERDEAFEEIEEFDEENFEDDDEFKYDDYFEDDDFEDVALEEIEEFKDEALEEIEEFENDALEEIEESSKKEFLTRIVGGNKAREGEFPFSIHYTFQAGGGLTYECGGSLISSNLVLSAAHCKGQGGRVRVGSVHARSGGVEASVIETLVHPLYDSNTLNYDYMILKLDRDINTNTYTPVKLSIDSDGLDTDDMLTVIGFGTLYENGPSSDDLMKVDVPVISQATCLSQYAPLYGSDAIIEDIHICAGYPQGGKDSCQGDSGGPIFKKIGGVTTQVGVVSWGKGCAQPGHSGVYARVSGVSSWLKSESCSRSSQPKPSYCNTAPTQPHNRWDQVDGRLKWASVSENGQHVWGVNSNDYIYYRNGANGNWVNIPGRLKQVSVSADGQHVWGVNSGDYIYYRNGVSGNWENIPGRLKQVSVSADGRHVWGVNSGDYIYYRNGKNGNWLNIAGRLKQVSVSADGQHVWGVNSGDYIYYRNGVNGSWVNIEGRLKQVSVSADGQRVWGVNSGDYIYYRNGKTGSWVNISGRLKQVSVSADGGYVWGVNSGDYIYKRD